MAMNDYNDFLAERRAKQFGFVAATAESPEEATSSVVVEDKPSKETTKKEQKEE